MKLDGQALTSNGENFDPAFSPKGDKVVFVSQGRPQHRQPQIYEYDLKTHKEKRITFQASNTAFPQYSPNGEWILYSSSTDELKEDPPLLHVKKPNEEFQGPAIYNEPFEIYLHRLQGVEIHRLTKRLLFDGEARFKGANELVFTRRTGQSLTLMSGSIRRRTVEEFKGAGPRSAQLAPSPDLKSYVWVEYAEDFKSSVLKVKVGKNDAITIGDGVTALRKDPSWTPDGKSILFSMSLDDPQKFQIYSIQPDGRCLTALTSEEARVEEPVASPQGTALLFVSNISGSRQLYLKPMPASACP